MLHLAFFSPRLQRLTLLVASTMTVMAGATISPSLPAMAGFFAEAPNAELWVRLTLTLPALFTAVGAPLAGLVIDRFGRRPLLIAATALYGVAGVAGGLVSSLGLLLASRALLGLSVGGIMTTAVTLIADYYEGEERGRVMGQQAAFMGFGGVFFLTAGGALADLSWRAPFAIYGLAFVILPFVVRYLPEPARPPRPGSPSQVAQTSNGAAPSESAVPWRAVAFLYGLAFLGMIAFYMIPVQLPFHLTAFEGVTGTMVGLAIASSTLASALASLRYGRIRERLGYQAVFLVLFAAMAAGFAVIALAGSYAVVIVGLVVLGLGTGLLLPNLNVWANQAAPAAVRGRVVGGLTTAIFLGQFCSPLVTQPVIESAGSGGAYGVVGIGMAALALLFGVARIGRGRSDAHTQPPPVASTEPVSAAPADG